MTRLAVCFMFLITSFFSIFKIKNKKDYQFLFLIISSLLLVLIIFRNGEELNDYHVYVNMYTHYKDPFVALYVEPSFLVISYLLNFLSLSVIFLFAVYGFLALYLKVSLIKKISPYYYLSLVGYISYEYINQELIAIRAGVAIAFLLYSIYFLKNSNIKLYFLCVFIAVLFHYSSFVFIPFIIFNKLCKSNKNRIILLFLSFIMFFIDFSFLGKLIPIKSIRNKVINYLSNNNNSFIKTICRPTILYRYFILFFFIYYEKLVMKKNTYCSIEINYLLYGLFLNNVFGFNETLAYRMSMLGFSVEYLLLPNIVLLIREKNLAKLLVVFLSAFNLLYSIYISHIFH